MQAGSTKKSKQNQQKTKKNAPEMIWSSVSSVRGLQPRVFQAKQLVRPEAKQPGAMVNASDNDNTPEESPAAGRVRKAEKTKMSEVLEVFLFG